MIKSNNFGTLMKIIDVLPNDKVLIQFQDSHKYEKEIHWNNFKKGTVKNPYDPIRFNVGYFGVGDYYAISKGYRPKVYDVWSNMIERCYSEKHKDIHPAYYNICTVCDEWLNFQNFAQWYEDNFYDLGDGTRMHIDKDVLVKGNKVYSPSTCVILPQRINMIFMEKTKKRDKDLPNTIHRCATGFQASYNGKYLGVFKTIEDAISAHDSKMRIHIKQVANEYKDRLPPYIYDALLKW